MSAYFGFGTQGGMVRWAFFLVSLFFLVASIHPVIVCFTMDALVDRPKFLGMRGVLFNSTAREFSSVLMACTVYAVPVRSL